MSRSILPLALTIGLLATVARAESDSPIGRQIADFTLDNCYGKPVTLSEIAKDKPAAKPQPKSGRWIRRPELGRDDDWVHGHDPCQGPTLIGCLHRHPRLRHAEEDGH